MIKLHVLACRGQKYATIIFKHFIPAIFGNYYFKTCDVIHSMKEKCRSIDIILRIPHVLNKLGQHRQLISL